MNSVLVLKLTSAFLFGVLLGYVICLVKMVRGGNRWLKTQLEIPIREKGDYL